MSTFSDVYYGLCVSFGFPRGKRVSPRYPLGLPPRRLGGYPPRPPVIGEFGQGRDSLNAIRPSASAEAHRSVWITAEAVGLLYANKNYFRSTVYRGGRDFSYGEGGDAACGRRKHTFGRCPRGVGDEVPGVSWLCLPGAKLPQRIYIIIFSIL